MTDQISDGGSDELVLPALTLADLSGVRDFLRQSLERLDCPGACDAVVLAVDEVCANLAEHGAKDGPQGPVCIRVRREAFDAIITVEDEGPPFDPADAPPPDLASNWEDRRVGGLGWFLVRQMVDDLTYESNPQFVEGVQIGVRNRLTLIKRASCGAPHIARD